MAKRTFTDQLGREIQVSFPPQKIISLVPSQTELLFDLNLNEKISALTKFCIHPKELVVNKEKVGGTKTLNLDKIGALKPELIIANKEENTQAEIEDLASKFPVWVSDIQNLNDALDMIQRVGAITDTEGKALQISDSIRKLFRDLKPLHPPLRAAYLIWRKPYMSVNRHTFIHDMLERAGFINVCAAATERYPEISETALAELNPDVLLLSSEPYPFGEKDIQELGRILPVCQIALVDGELFSWYGSRLLHSPDYFRKLVRQLSHPPQNHAPHF